MDMEQDLRMSLNNNQREIFIIEAEELLAAWLYKKRSSPKRSRNMCAVPTELRCTRPNSKPHELMPCHVSIREKAGQTITRVTPAPEYSTNSCHGHGTMKQISLSELEALDSMDRLEAITLTKTWVAPYVSPFLDTITLARVARDLGIDGKAIPKVIKGRQYFAFVTKTGARRVITMSLYSARHAKVINMAIGAMGITKMATKGSIITFVLTVPFSVWKCIIEDQTAWYQITGTLGADLIKVGTASLVGAVSGILATGGSTFFVCPPIGLAILVSVGVGFALEYIDDKYKLTDKLIEHLKQLPVEADKISSATGQSFWNMLRGSGYNMGSWGSVLR